MSDFELSRVSEKESMQYFSEGLRQAASAANALAHAQRHPIWFDIEKLLSELHNQGVMLSRAKSLTRMETLNILDARQKANSGTLNEHRETKSKLII